MHRPYIRDVRLAFLLAVILSTSGSVMADAVRITSPNHPQTFAYGEVIWHQLYLDTAGDLAARITFSNRPYAGDDEPRRDEAFDFHFPGVRLNSARATFLARSGHSEFIPVARFRGGLASGWIDLASGTKIYLLKDHGRVTAALTATDYPRIGTRWVEMDNNFSLQNLLTGLFSGLTGDSDD